MRTSMLAESDVSQDFPALRSILRLGSVIDKVIMVPMSYRVVLSEPGKVWSISRMNDVKNSRAMAAFSSFPKQSNNSAIANELKAAAFSHVESGEQSSSISSSFGINFDGVLNIVSMRNDAEDDFSDETEVWPSVSFEFCRVMMVLVW